jgi:ABC-type amino acid transport substrate-binding protein
MTRRDAHAVACCALAALALIAVPPAGARTLAELQARGVVSQCANPDALPHSSNRSDRPGFQIEIGRALAEALGLKHEVQWIVPRLRAGLVDCDLLLDTIVAPGLERGPLRVSKPYQRSGVVLALRPGAPAATGFDDLARDLRIGVLVNSVASKLLGERGVHTVPFAFEADMIADLADGTLDGCAVSPATIAYFVHEHPQAGVRVVRVYEREPELAWTLAVGMRRSDDALVEAVDRALARMMDDGTLARIYAGYGVEYRRP